MPQQIYCDRCGCLQLVEQLGLVRFRCLVCKNEFATITHNPLAFEQKTSVSSILPLNGGVYLIKSGGYFKIGKADDFSRRIKQIKLQLPEKMEEVHRIYTDDPLGIESYWHKRFKDKRLNGEWFALSEEDVRLFKSRDKM